MGNDFLFLFYFEIQNKFSLKEKPEYEEIKRLSKSSKKEDYNREKELIIQSKVIDYDWLFNKIFNAIDVVISDKSKIKRINFENSSIEIGLSNFEEMKSLVKEIWKKYNIVKYPCDLEIEFDKEGYEISLTVSIDIFLDDDEDYKLEIGDITLETYDEKWIKSPKQHLVNWFNDTIDKLKEDKDLIFGDDNECDSSGKLYIKDNKLYIKKEKKKKNEDRYSFLQNFFG